MAISLFGWQIRKAKEEDQLPSFAPPQADDGASIVQQQGTVGGAYGTYLDLDGTARTEAELVTKYRTMAMAPEVRAAIDNIVNEAIVVQKETPIVQVDMHALPDLPDPVKEAIKAEFEECLRLLEFKTKAYDIFRTWYVDGRLYYHCIIDPKNPAAGLQELRWLDARKTKKIKEVKTERVGNTATGGQVVNLLKVVAEYFVYNERGFDGRQQTQMHQVASNVGTNDVAIRITKDSVAHVTSGILDETGRFVYSYLHDAIRPLNMFRTVSDSAIIYRLVRAPQRRVFYIDVGDLPKHKAEQYVNDMMTKYKNKLVFDPATGAMKDSRKHMTMLEDFWLSRREGGRGTQIETLDGAANWGVMDEVQFFLKMLYKSLHVPLARLDPEYVAPLGRAGEITREEVDFAKFVDRVRTKFCELFLTVLGKQLLLKGVMLPDEWEAIKYDLEFDWAKDNYFAELKELSVATERFSAIQLVMPFVGRFVSNEWVRKKLLFQTDEEFETINQQIMMERADPLYMVNVDAEGNPLGPVDGGVNVPPPLPGQPDEGGPDTSNVKLLSQKIDHENKVDKLQRSHDKELEKHKQKFGDLQQRHRELRVKHAAKQAKRPAGK